MKTYNTRYYMVAIESPNREYIETIASHLPSSTTPTAASIIKALSISSNSSNPK